MFLKRGNLVKQRTPQSSIPSHLFALIHVSSPGIPFVYIHWAFTTCWEHTVTQTHKAYSLMRV